MVIGIVKITDKNFRITIPEEMRVEINELKEYQRLKLKYEGTVGVIPG